MFEQVIRAIRDHDTIILHRHANPDGDALGSQIGLALILRENFPGKKIYTVGDGAGRFSFMEGSVMDEIPDEAYAGALAVILDTSAKALISDGRYALAARTVRLDHHIFCEKIADIEVTDTTYESCCGLVADFVCACGLRLTPAAAKALYTGMVTDSGRFRYDSTSARTHRIAARLMEQNFDAASIYRELYADDLARVMLRAAFTLKIKRTEAGVGYIYTTDEEARASGADLFSISRGMVNTMSDIRGIEIWVNFTESPSGVLCELRSNRHNINPIAVKYGGGGHAKASGATLPDRETAMAMLRDLDAMLGGTV